MQYGQLITRPFALLWSHRYLWLLAVLGGADIGGGGFPAGNFGGFNPGPSGGPPSAGGTVSPTPAGGAQQMARFLQDNLGLIAAIAGLVLVVALAWFLLSCVTTGALVRASAEHDAERPFGLGLAWRAGVGTFWSILGLRLLLFVWTLVFLGVVAVFVVLGIVAATSGSQGGLAADIAAGVLVFLALLVLSIPVGIAFILATRAVVLEQRGAIAGLGRAVQLLRARLGRVLLVWLIQVGLGLAAGVVIAVPLIILFVVGGGLVFGAAVAGGPVAAITVGIPVVLVVFAVILVLSGITGGYFSTYWTLAFRRMELDVPRPAAWPPPAYPQQPAG